MDWDIRRIRAGTNVKNSDMGESWIQKVLLHFSLILTEFIRLTLASCETGDRCSRGTQGIRQSRWFWPSRESWICGILDLYDFYATKMCYQLRQQCHGSWDGFKAEINFGVIFFWHVDENELWFSLNCTHLIIICGKISIVRFRKMLQIIQESHVQKVQRTHWQALCCLCQWHLWSKRKTEKSIPNHPWLQV